MCLLRLERRRQASKKFPYEIYYVSTAVLKYSKFEKNDDLCAYVINTHV